MHENIKRIINKYFLLLNNLYLSIYSYWKVNHSDVKFTNPLSSQERGYFLNYNFILMENDLVVFDIGASLGSMSSFFAKMPNIVEIHAFEPISSVYHKLVHKLAKFPKVFCHNVALGEDNRTVEMHVMPEYTASSSLLEMKDLHKREFPKDYTSYIESVTMVTLDTYVAANNLPQPHIIKVDVQGYEDRVIKGGLNTFKNTKYCILEASFQALYENSLLFNDLYNIMKELNFKLVGIESVTKGKSGIPLFADCIFKNMQSK